MLLLILIIYLVRNSSAKNLKVNSYILVNFDDLGRDGRHDGFAAMLDVEEEAVLFRDLGRNRLIDGLIHRGEDFHLHQFRDQFERFQAERDGEFADNNRRL